MTELVDCFGFLGFTGNLCTGLLGFCRIRILVVFCSFWNVLWVLVVYVVLWGCFCIDLWGKGRSLLLVGFVKWFTSRFGFCVGFRILGLSLSPLYFMFRFAWGFGLEALVLY